MSERNFAAELAVLPKEHDFLVGIDSDGCVFDSMEVKQKECFCPAFIKHFGFQSVSRYAREVWEFVNLYSKTRGCNRFLALQRALALMEQRPIFAARGVSVKPIPELDAWIRDESKLGNPALEAKVVKTGDPALTRLLAWSHEVNARIEDMVYGVAPFSKVLPCLQAMQEKADVIVVSQTPFEALDREWREHGLADYVRFIAGQEAGTKTEHLDIASTGKYDRDKVLMIGDAPGDYKAAAANGVLFYPVTPGEEEEAWDRLHGEALDRFFGGTYAGAYQDELLAAFDSALPVEPDWDRPRR